MQNCKIFFIAGGILFFLVALLIIFGQGVSVVYSSDDPDSPGALANKKLLSPVTIDLSADRIELEAVKEIRPYEPYEEKNFQVQAKHVLKAQELEAFKLLWRRQSFHYTEYALCHEAAYRFRFYQQKKVYLVYQQEKLLAEGTICFNCHNIYLEKSDVLNLTDHPMKIGMDSQAPETKALQDYFSKLFAPKNSNGTTSP